MSSIVKNNTLIIQENVGLRGEKGDQGYTPYIGENKHWWINGIDTGVIAQGTSEITKVPTYANLPTIGDSRKCYITEDKNTIYTWNEAKMAYVPVIPSIDQIDGGTSKLLI